MTEQPGHIERPPIVVVMGHVDHGKSTLLDYIRKTNTVAKEAGGITQHVAAYEVEHEKDGVKKRITFIDTPGHAAFQAIRARGANAADIAILVVAADDGVKAQTLEALESIKQSGIPFVVAINKIDKPNADVMRTQNSLAEHGVYLEKLGGDISWAAISAKSGAGVDELLNLILIVAELEELRADPKALASGYVIEAHRDPKRGLAATLIITNGTLLTGMAICAGSGVAPVRLMENHAGKTLKSASFSTPVTIVGFDEMPNVGSTFVSFESKKEAEATAAEEKAKATVPVFAQNAEGRFLFPVVVRADASGTLEAIRLELGKLGDEHMGVTVVQEGVGTITESDVKTAVATKSPNPFVIGFNASTDTMAHVLAQRDGVRIETFSIIYKMTERVEELMRKSAPKRTIETILGKARVLKLFSEKRNVHLIGCSVLEGYFSAGKTVRAVRRGEILGEGTVLNMQSNRQNVSKVESGAECGIEVEIEAELASGDILEHVERKTI
ncbi:translation initiation factor IF-2 [bacterium]|nr:translation initiation factor IF-2 [bacterium]